MQTRQASNMTSSGLSLLRSGPQAHFSRVFLSREMKRYDGEHRRKEGSFPYLWHTEWSPLALILQRGLLTATFQIPFPLRARQTGKVVQWPCSPSVQEAQDSMSSTGLKRLVGRADKKGGHRKAEKQCSRTKGLSRIVILTLLAVLRTEGRAVPMSNILWL